MKCPGPSYIYIYDILLCVNKLHYNKKNIVIDRNNSINKIGDNSQYPERSSVGYNYVIF